MKSRSIAMAGAALLAGAVWSQASYANTFTVDVWTSVESASKNAQRSAVPGTTPNFVYDFSTTTGALDLSLPSGGNDSVAGFLATEPLVDGTFTCVGSCTGAGTAPNLQNSFFEITGTTFVSAGEKYSITHDDGASLYIDGVKVIQSPSPTNLKTSSGTYTGSNVGNQSFELVYGENNGLPADLLATLPIETTTSTTPLPATLPLLAGGLGFLGFLGRRKRKATSAFAA